MKKIDKLIINSFFGPFFLTFFVVIFILLSQFMLKYLDEIVGKDLDTSVIVQLIFYFSIFMTPNAFPLAVLLSSLMTFGNLGEHFELTALKGSGISLIRVMTPIFVFTIFLTGAAYYSNNFIVPKANLKAFSLLYDVKQMKPSMELKEGTFYNGIEGYSIKVGEKLSDGKSLRDLIIYDHTARKGNVHVTMADSGQMYNIYNDRYLVLEMFDGKTYIEDEPDRKRRYMAQQYPDPMIRNEFAEQKVVFSLASFDLKRTKEELFSSNRLMKNAGQLTNDVDSMKAEFYDKTEEVKEHSFRFFEYHLQDIMSVYKQRALEREAKEQAEEEAREMEEQERMEAKYKAEIQLKVKDSLDIKTSGKKVFVPDTIDSDKNLSQEKKDKLKDRLATPGDIPKSAIPKSLVRKNTKINRKFEFDGKDEKVDEEKEVLADSGRVKPTFEENMAIIDSLMNKPDAVKNAFTKCLTHVRYVKNNMSSQSGRLEKLKTEINKFQLERYKKLSYAITILIMFFIGAPLGAIIKRGGLGIPVLISLSFFILFYVISMICEKWTRTDVMDPLLAAWMANIILFPIGMFFMKQAKNDARLFETDFYSVIFLKVKSSIFSLKQKFKKNK